MENFADAESCRLAKAATRAATTSHLSPSRRSHNIHVRYVHGCTCERASRGSTGIGEGKRRREFVIVIARRGRAAIVITARHRSYRRVGLLRPVRIYSVASIPARSTSPGRLVFSRHFTDFPPRTEFPSYRRTFLPPLFGNRILPTGNAVFLIANFRKFPFFFLRYFFEI